MLNVLPVLIHRSTNQTRPGQSHLGSYHSSAGPLAQGMVGQGYTEPHQPSLEASKWNVLQLLYSQSRKKKQIALLPSAIWIPWTLPVNLWKLTRKLQFHPKEGKKPSPMTLSDPTCSYKKCFTLINNVMKVTLIIISDVQIPCMVSCAHKSFFWVKWANYHNNERWTSHIHESLKTEKSKKQK